MKLLYILSEYLPDSGGGIITHYSRILPRLVERGHCVKVILASAGKLDQPAYVVDGVHVEPLKSRFLEKYKGCFDRWAGLDIFYYMLPLAWAAWAQAQEGFDYDVVEATDWALLFAPWVASSKRSPLVVSLHGSCGQVDWHVKGWGKGLDGDLVRLAETLAMRSADVLHANSRANAEFWTEKTGREISIIPPASEVSVNADSEFPTIESQGGKGLVVGRLQNWKGAEVLCQALRGTPEIQIEWVGGDTEWEESKKTASEHLAEKYPDVWGSSLFWLGRVDHTEVRQKILEADFLVAPSIWDVFNLTVAEAMESGLPVVCSCAAGAEMLIIDGKSGFLFKSGNPESLAERLCEVANLSAERRKAIGREARESVRQVMNPETILDMLEKSYQSIANQGNYNTADEWIQSVFAAEPEESQKTPPGVIRRITRKAGRILSNV